MAKKKMKRQPKRRVQKAVRIKKANAKSGRDYGRYIGAGLLVLGLGLGGAFISQSGVLEMQGRAANSSPRTLKKPTAKKAEVKKIEVKKTASKKPVAYKPFKSKKIVKVAGK